MATPFTVELTMRQPPSEAQARAESALKDPAHRVGLRLTKRGAGELGYTPRVQFPFLLMLWHSVNRERMTITFRSGADGGTKVTISGAVARSNHPLAADPEHWSEPLGVAASG